MRVNNNFISTVTTAGNKMIFFSTSKNQLRFFWNWNLIVRNTGSFHFSFFNHFALSRECTIYLPYNKKKQIDLNSKKTIKMIDEIRIETRQNNHCCNTTETPQEDIISKLESLKFLINHHFCKEKRNLY